MQAEQAAAHYRAQGMQVQITPHQHGGLWVQAWYPQPAHAAPPHHAHASHYAQPPGPCAHPPAPPAPAPPQPTAKGQPGWFRRLLLFAASEPKGFNGVAFVVAILVGLPVFGIWQLVRLDRFIAVGITAGLAAVLTLIFARMVKLSGFMTLTSFLFAAVVGALGMFLVLQPKHALVIVDNRSESTIHVFADGERIGSVDPGHHEKLEVDVRTERIGWGTSKKKPKNKKKVSMEEADHYLLSPEGGRCYLMVQTSYSLTGIGEPTNDSVEWLPSKTWQRLSPPPDVEFADNPQTISVELGTSDSVSRSLRRSLTCSELASCAAKERKALLACYDDANGEDDVKACEAEAKKRCGDGA